MNSNSIIQPTTSSWSASVGRLKLWRTQQIIQFRAPSSTKVLHRLDCCVHFPKQWRLTTISYHHKYALVHVWNSAPSQPRSSQRTILWPLVIACSRESELCNLTQSWFSIHKSSAEKSMYWENGWSCIVLHSPFSTFCSKAYSIPVFQNHVYQMIRLTISNYFGNEIDKMKISFLPSFPRFELNAILFVYF